MELYHTQDSIQSRVHSLSVCDSILANVSQRLSVCDTPQSGLRLSLEDFSGFCTSAPHSQFFLIKKILFSLFPSHVQASSCYFFQFVLVLSLRDYLFFQVEMKESFFHFQILWSLLQLQEAALDKFTGFWGRKEGIQLNQRNTETQNIFYTPKETLGWLIKKKTVFFCLQCKTIKNIFLNLNIPQIFFYIIFSKYNGNVLQI